MITPSPPVHHSDGSSFHGSLPLPGVSVRLGATTTLIEGELEREPNYFLHDIVVTPDWVESKYYIVTPVGDHLDTYVLGTPEFTVAYQPATSVQQVTSFFADLGTAAYGSTPTPYDDLRILETAVRLSTPVQWELARDGGRTVHFTKPGSSQTMSLSFSAQDHLTSSLLIDEDNVVTVERKFADYRPVGNGWYPATAVFTTRSTTQAPDIVTHINTLSVEPLSPQEGAQPPPRPTFGPNVRTVAFGNTVNPTPPALGPNDRPIDSAPAGPTPIPPSPSQSPNYPMIALAASAVVTLIGLALWFRSRSRP